MDQRQRTGLPESSSVDAPPTRSARLTPQSIRALLSNLDRPHRLDTPEIRTLLRACGRSPSKTTPTAVGAAAASLTRDKIAALEAPSGSTWAQRIPHAVLETCFLRGLKNYQAAQELGVSERQLSRERTRALQLLAEELAPPAPVSVSPDRVPSTDGHFERGALVRRLAELAAKERLVAVVGRRRHRQDVGCSGVSAPGPQRPRLVAADPPGLNDSLETLLLELGRTLSGDGFPALRDYLVDALPRRNLGTATRLALDGLARSPRLMVIDDFDRVLDPAPIEHFLQEGVERVEQLTVVTIGKGLIGGTVVEIPPLSLGEAAELVKIRTVTSHTEAVRALHGVVGGHTGIMAAAAAWWSDRAGARRLFERQVTNKGALSNLRDVVAFSRARPTTHTGTRNLTSPSIPARSPGGDPFARRPRRNRRTNRRRPRDQSR